MISRYQSTLKAQAASSLQLGDALDVDVEPDDGDFLGIGKHEGVIVLIASYDRGLLGKGRKAYEFQISMLRLNMGQGEFGGDGVQALVARPER
jgi:hypothetical protein